MASMVPTRKVGAGTLAGAAVVILIKLSKDFLGYEIDGEFASALTVLATFAVSYFIPDAEKVDAA